MDLETAKVQFDRAMRHCDNVMTVHTDHGGGGRGFRTLEPSLNRAVVVMAVAAWQSVVQDFTEAALDFAQPPGGTGVGLLLRGRVLQEIGGFSTPDATKSRDLMKLVDFDPYPTWTWRQSGGQGVGSVTITPAQAAGQINAWLRLRHDIAHGHPRLSVVEVLENVRVELKTWKAAHPAATHKDALDHLRHDAGFIPALRLTDARRCVALFRRLASLTGKGLAKAGVGPDCW